MKEKTIAFSIMMVITSSTALAASTNPLDSINGLGTPSLTSDYIFKDFNLLSTLTQTINGYTLVVSDGNQIDSFNLNQTTGKTFGFSAAFTLTAYFESNGVFQSGSETIIGSDNGNTFPSAVDDLSNYKLPDGEINLFSANLINFGFNDGTSAHNEYSLGFSTEFNSSWATQDFFTGGSSGEVTYLTGITNTAPTLKNLTDAFAGGAAGLNQLTAQGGGAFSIGGVNSLTAVPLPLSSVLFGTGLALLGVGRQGLKKSNGV